MKNDRQTAAESWHNCHVLPYFNSEVTGLISTKFLEDVDTFIAAINACTYKAMLHSLSERQSNK